MKKESKFNECFLRDSRGDAWVDGLKQMAKNYSAQEKERKPKQKEK